MKTKRELLNELRGLEQKIISKLEGLGFYSFYKPFENGNKVKQNRTMGLIYNELNKGFYDFDTRMIKIALSVSSKMVLSSLMDSRHLEYRIKALESIYINLCNISFTKFDEQKAQIAAVSFNIGRKLREEFKKETRNIPITNLRKINSVSVIKERFIKQLDKITDDITRDDLLSESVRTRNYLKDTLPKRFRDKKAYGSAIGNLSKATYGFKTSELLSILKKSHSDILLVMNEKHLKYRLVSLVLIKKYAEMYNINEYDLFLDKCYIIGQIAKEIFEEREKQTPYIDLEELHQKHISNVVVNQNLAKAHYTLFKNNEQLIAEPGEEEQLSLFDGISRRREYKEYDI